jgi:C_GCAxxG_C_C family probable redox protein
MNTADLTTTALERFRAGFSCSQAVFSVFAGEMGLDREAALRLSQALGGGMAHLGQTCGALTGAFLAVGLKHGRVRPEDLAARDRTYDRMQELAARFREHFGGLTCPQVLGEDLATADGLRRAQEQNLFRRRCDEFVRAAVEWTAEIL